jgi:hypothetical protein
MIRDIDNTDFCLCTRPLFFNGINCDTTNEIITRNEIKISEEYDGRVNPESVKYLSCVDNGLVPVKLTNSFTCLEPSIKKIFDQLFYKRE